MRIYKYDNLRFVLMFLVISCHMMEGFNQGWVYDFYRIIYIFHMPAFIYLMGRFAEFNKKRIFLHFAVPYLVFQTLYLYFAGYVLNGESMITPQYTTPYWLLWFLMTAVFYHIILPMLPSRDSERNWPIILIIGGTIVVALIAGYDNNIGYYMTLSRTVVFFPFFLLGYYHTSISKKIKMKGNPLFSAMMIILPLILIFFGSKYLLDKNVTPQLLYGSYSYEACGGDAFLRTVVFAVAIGWIIFFNCIIPNIKIPIVTACGRNTMIAYLFHGFIVKLLIKNNVFHYSLTVNFAIAVVIAIVIMAVSGYSNHIVTLISRKRSV